MNEGNLVPTKYFGGTKVAEIVDSRTQAPGKRPNFPREFKRQLAEQTFEPGASVSLVARRNDINTNLLFRWRRQYLQGAFGAPHPEHARQQPDGDVAPLLPVSVVAETEASMSTHEAVTENTCEIEFDRARLRIRGNVSPDMLRLLIRELSR
ncbi:transposase [Paraburkholderia sp. RL18-103-BIB-C]|uniref:IS66-like element accessory protein TnpA n=1 Tax=Paraburkholderia sp. RL18-103-BIB-C TaxID=3031637 RepID=UPI0038BC46E9